MTNEKTRLADVREAIYTFDEVAMRCETSGSKSQSPLSRFTNESQARNLLGYVLTLNLGQWYDLTGDQKLRLHGVEMNRARNGGFEQLIVLVDCELLEGTSMVERGKLSLVLDGKPLEDRLSHVPSPTPFKDKAVHSAASSTKKIYSFLGIGNHRSKVHTFSDTVEQCRIAAIPARTEDEAYSASNMTIDMHLFKDLLHEQGISSWGGWERDGIDASRISEYPILNPPSSILRDILLLYGARLDQERIVSSIGKKADGGFQSREPLLQNTPPSSPLFSCSPTLWPSTLLISRSVATAIVADLLLKSKSRYEQEVLSRRYHQFFLEPALGTPLGSALAGLHPALVTLSTHSTVDCLLALENPVIPPQTGMLLDLYFSGMVYFHNPDREQKRRDQQTIFGSELCGKDGTLKPEHIRYLIELHDAFILEWPDPRRKERMEQKTLALDSFRSRLPPILVEAYEKSLAFERNYAPQ